MQRSSEPPPYGKPQDTASFAMPLVAEDLLLHQADTPGSSRISMQIARGELVSVVAENGAGKTTLLRNLHEPRPKRLGLDKERLVVCGIDMTRRNAEKKVRRLVSVVPQGDALVRTFTVRENLDLNPSQALSNEEAEVILAMTGLRGLENQLPHQLSLGERKLASVARALAGEPSLLILDDPFDVISSRRADLLTDLLSALVKQHIVDAVLLATSRFELAAKISTRSYELRQSSRHTIHLYEQK